MPRRDPRKDPGPGTYKAEGTARKPSGDYVDMHTMPYEADNLQDAYHKGGKRVMELAPQGSTLVRLAVYLISAAVFVMALAAVLLEGLK